MVATSLLDPSGGWGESAGGGAQLRDFAQQVMATGKVEDFEGLVMIGEVLEFLLHTIEKVMDRSEEVASMLPQAQRSDFAIGGPILTRLEEVWNLVKGQEDQEREAKQARDEVALLAEMEADSFSVPEATAGVQGEREKGGRQTVNVGQPAQRTGEVEKASQPLASLGGQQPAWKEKEHGEPVKKRSRTDLTQVPEDVPDLEDIEDVVAREMAEMADAGLDHPTSTNDCTIVRKGKEALNRLQE